MAAPNIQGQQTEYKPWGVLAGAMVGREQADMDAANLLALRESQLGNVVKERDAAFAQDEMDNPELRSSRLQGMIGDNQVKTAAGLTAIGTQDSDMKAKIAENIAKVPKAHVEKALAETHQQTLGLMGLASALEQGGGSDLNFVTKAMSMAPQLGMRPEDLKQLLSNPELLKSKIEKNQQMLTMVPAVLQKMAEQEQNNKTHGLYITGPQNDSHERVAQGNNAATIQAARIAADSRLAVATARNKATDILTQVQAGKLGYEKAATAFEIMSSMSTDPEEIKRYSNMAKAFSVADQKSKAAGRQVPVDLSAVGVQTQQVTPTLGNGGTSEPKVGQTKSGVKYKVVP